MCNTLCIEHVIHFSGGDFLIFNSNQPVYTQIATLIKEKIITGEYKSGMKLPSVRETAKGFKVNPNTVQKAYRELEAMNLILTKKNSGSIITEDITVINNLREKECADVVIHFGEKMKGMGFSKEGIIEVINKLIKED